MFRSLAVLATLVMVVGVGQAGPLKVGDPMPSFSNLQTTTGKTISSGDFNKDVLVVCVTCNHCPVAVAYEDRIVKFYKDTVANNPKIGFLAICVNNLEEDKLPAMKERAKQKGFTFTYAHDPSQKIGKDLGATKTPEFFVFHKGKLTYTGAMDDDQAKPTTNYVEQAVKAALSGAQPPKCTEPRGCGIKYETK
jgi:peroxiredoxin